jgi:hypothetical protein
LLLALVWVQVLLTSNCTGWHFSESITRDLASHLGAGAAAADIQHSTDHAASWDSLLSIRRQLTGSGFHKTLQLELHPVPSSVGSAQACQLSLLQPLPSSIFADPYQLEDLTRGSEGSAAGAAPGYSYSFSLLGALDLEL